jgi:transposase
MAVEITRSEHSVGELRRAAAGAKDGKAARRMLALALVLEGKSRTEAAEQCGMDRQTLRDWVHRYNEAGLAGLYDRPVPGRPARLTPGQMGELKAIVEEGADPAVHGVVRFRRIDLCEIVEGRFGIRIAERTMGGLLKKLGFGRLSVRPQHPQSDPAAQDLYKKLRRTGAPNVAREGARKATGNLVPG